MWGRSNYWRFSNCYLVWGHRRYLKGSSWKVQILCVEGVCNMVPSFLSMCRGHHQSMWSDAAENQQLFEVFPVNRPQHIFGWWRFIFHPSSHSTISMAKEDDQHQLWATQQKHVGGHCVHGTAGSPRIFGEEKG